MTGDTKGTRGVRRNRVTGKRSKDTKAAMIPTWVFMFWSIGPTTIITTIATIATTRTVGTRADT